MSHASSTLTGDNGQLIDRLRAAIDELGSRVPAALSLLILGVEIDLTVREHPSTDPAERGLALIEDRVWELVADGVSESFLVVGIRDRISEILRGQADNLGKVNENRRAVQQRMLDLMDDPARFRAWANENNPGCAEASWTDEQIAAERQDGIDSPMFGELGIDQASSAWRAKAAWADITTSTLSDSIIDTWRQRWIAKGVLAGQ